MSRNLQKITVIIRLDQSTIPAEEKEHTFLVFKSKLCAPVS